MFTHLGWFIGLHHKERPAKRVPDAKPRQATIKPLAMLDTVQEIAIYIHRFHNLDLFQQGWYQIKITMRWEDNESTLVGTPARVVQYEAPDLGLGDTYGVWKIDDIDNSFSTQPFRIKYARQDVLLSIMISFNLPLNIYEGPSTSAVILKFELMYAPIMVDRLNLEASLDASSAAVHEFRIPPKALLGLHSYFPVHFDAFHAVLVDVSIHICLLNSYTSRAKISSDSKTAENVARKPLDWPNQALGKLASGDVKEVMLVKALMSARDILLEEILRLSKAVDKAIDLSDFMSRMNDLELFNSVFQANIHAADGNVFGQDKQQNGLQNVKGGLDFQRDELLHSLSGVHLLNFFLFLGDHLLYLWNTFLKFHRANKTKILEYLCDAWTKDRRAEWSIWMVHSKVEMPHHYINGVNDEPSHHGAHKRITSLWKLADDPSQTAAMRADIHRRGIAQMKINNRSIQDMHIFGDLSRIPVVIVERIMNVPRCTNSEVYLRHLDLIDTLGLQTASSSELGDKTSGTNTHKSGHVLKIVIFVHGFQGHHLDLRLVRNQWLLIDPKIEILMSEANEDKTAGDFKEMGQRLAQEVISFVKKKIDKVSRYGSLGDIKLSFVGHSIGNVIIRTALAESIMKPFLRHLHTYVSISGPHLGYLYSSNSLFNSGLWLLKKLKGTQCIHQLTFTDDPDLQNTFFYKLCKVIFAAYMITVFSIFSEESFKDRAKLIMKQRTLDNFKHIILFSSPQDGYVPYHSARIELCQAAAMDYSKKGKVFLEMLNDCLDQIRAPSFNHKVFMRCDVNFDTSSYGKNLNTFIGRAAHIEFLESDLFVRFIMWSFPELFR